MEQVTARGAVTQLGVAAWRGKYKDVELALKVFQEGGNPSLLQFPSSEAAKVARDCFSLHREKLLRLLRKVSERRTSYTTSDMVEEFLRITSDSNKEPFSKVG